MSKTSMYARSRNLFCLEVMGGATFDVKKTLVFLVRIYKQGMIIEYSMRI